LPYDQNGQRACEQQAAFDPRGQPGDDGGADAHNDRAKCDEQSGVANADTKPIGQYGQHSRWRQNGKTGGEIAEHQGDARKKSFHEKFVSVEETRMSQLR
jgi:hypothetical protein